MNTKEKLISEVRKYNFLYDLSDSKYCDSVKREEAWKEISKTLAVPVSTCKRTWLNLREAHRRAIKKKKSKSIQGIVPKKKWRYEDEMDFLKPHFKERRIVSTHPRDSDEESTGNEDSQMSVPDCQSDASITEDRPTSASCMFMQRPAHTFTSKFPKEKKPRLRHMDDGSSTSSLLMKYILKKKEKKIQEDDIDKFFSGIAATVKKFKKYNKALIKAQIFNIVSEMELREINEKENNTTE